MLVCTFNPSFTTTGLLLEPGGQYFWTNELAPRRYANFASYLTGWFAWAGSIFTSASVALGLGSALVGCWLLGHPGLYVFPGVYASQAANINSARYNPGTCSLPTKSSTQFAFFSTAMVKRCPGSQALPFTSPCCPSWSFSSRYRQWHLPISMQSLCLQPSSTTPAGTTTALLSLSA